MATIPLLRRELFGLTANWTHDLTVNSGAAYIANSNDVIDSIFGAGSIDIGANTLEVKEFYGILQSDSLGSFVKSRNISLTLLGNNSSFLGLPWLSRVRSS